MAYAAHRWTSPGWPAWTPQSHRDRRHAAGTIAALQDATRRIEAGSLDLGDPRQKHALAELAVRAAELAYGRPMRRRRRPQAATAR